MSNKYLKKHKSGKHTKKNTHTVPAFLTALNQLLMVNVLFVFYCYTMWGYTIVMIYLFCGVIPDERNPSAALQWTRSFPKLQKYTQKVRNEPARNRGRMPRSKH